MQNVCAQFCLEATRCPSLSELASLNISFHICKMKGDGVGQMERIKIQDTETLNISIPACLTLFEI